MPSAQLELMVLGARASGPRVERPASSPPESHPAPAAVQRGALYVVSYSAVLIVPPPPSVGGGVVLPLAPLATSARKDAPSLANLTELLALPAVNDRVSFAVWIFGLSVVIVASKGIVAG